MPSPQTPLAGGTATDPTAIRPAIDDARIERIDPAALRARVAELIADGFSMLLDIGAVDYLQRSPRFDVVYHLLAVPTSSATPVAIGTPRRVRLLVGVDGEAPKLPSVTDLFLCADWAEREVFDLFGIVFDGHPNLRRIQMPENWEGYPLRKDYPLRGNTDDSTPRPSFALKSNVPAGVPPTGNVAAALQRQIARARGQQEPKP